MKIFYSLKSNDIHNEEFRSAAARTIPEIAKEIATHLFISGFAGFPFVIEIENPELDRIYYYEIDVEPVPNFITKKIKEERR